MKQDTKARSLSAVAALLVLAVFAVSILWVLLGGAGVYRRLISRDDGAFESRTCAQYIATKLRQAPQPGDVAVAPFGVGDALVIPQTIEGSVYLTRIYCHEGWLMELFCDAEGEFSPEDGEKILPAAGWNVKIRDGLVAITVGTNQTQYIALRAGGVAP